MDGRRAEVRILIIMNRAPYGDETAFNTLRLALALQADPGKPDLELFLVGEAVGCALPNQMTPQGYYNIERMEKSLLGKGARIFACSSCLQARGLMELDLVEGVEAATMPQLAQMVMAADKVLTF
jgi:uncharacterized protein involved in oxidation of intracellular sulfur